MKGSAKPIAEQVTEGADRMHQVLFNAKLGIEDRLRLTQDPHRMEKRSVGISGISHNTYRGVDGHRRNRPCRESWILEPGDRAPDLVLFAKRALAAGV